MKNFFKKLAFVLALAMVVTAFAPAAQASAAKAPTLSATSKKLYLGGDKSGKYEDKFTLKVWNKGDYSVTFASDNTAVATVSKWYGVVEAKAVGTATITATVSNKETKKVVTTLSAKVYVKLNADSVAFGSLAKFDQPLVVGDKVKVNVARKAGDVAVWKQADKDKITDYVVWASSNTEVAKVDKWGTVTAVAPGEATISAVATQIEGKLATTDAATVKVTVVAKGITAVKQTDGNVIKVTFGTAQDDKVVTKDTLVITPADSTKATPIVKSLSFNDAKTEATVTTYLDFSDKAVYTVTVKDTDMKGEFAASIGEVVSITITKPGTVVAGSDLAEVVYELKDANDVLVDKATNARVQVDVVEGDQNGYTGDKGEGKIGVSVFEKGKTVVLKATYFTGKFTDEGEEIKIESSAFVVTGIAQTDVTLSTTKATIAKETPNWDDFTQKNTIGLTDTGYKVYAWAKDSNGDKYETQDKFDFESLNTAIVEVDSTGALYPITAGVAYIKVKHILSEKSFLVQVTVGAERKATSFVFDKYSATASDAENVDDEVTFKATVKDQYNEKMTIAADDFKVSPLSELAKTVDLSKEENKLVFNAGGLDAGTYTYKVTVGDISRTVSVVVRENKGETKSYKFEISNEKIDLAITKDNDKASNVKFALYGLDSNGVKTEKLAPTAYKVTVARPKGDDVVLNNTSNVDSNNNYIVNINTVADGFVSINEDFFQKAGTYAVTVELGGKTLTKKAFVVSNTQIVPIVKQESTTITHTVSGSSITLAEVLKAEKAFSVTTKNNGTVAANDLAAVNTTVISRSEGATAGTITGATALTKGTYKLVITKVDIVETFDDGSFVHKDVTVSKSITIVIK